jgi:hypothetical protein
MLYVAITREEEGPFKGPESTDQRSDLCKVSVSFRELGHLMKIWASPAARIHRVWEAARVNAGSCKEKYT